jgi:hypothetical protein
MRLVRVELSRLRSRRAVALLLVAAALLTALIAGATLWNTRPVTPSELGSARAQVAAQLSSPEFARELKSCRTDPEQYLGPDADASGCKQALTPLPESYLDRSPLSLEQQRDSSGQAVVVILVALMIIIGATYAGADWATGSMSNQMLFEPRRVRVWRAKAVAVLVGCTVAAAVLLVAFWLALYLVAEARGIPTGAVVQAQIRGMVLRSVVLAGLAGLGGYALTMLLRSTVASLALLFAYAAGGEALLALAPLDRSGTWSLTNNLFAWVRNGVQVYDPSVLCRPGWAACDQQYTVSLVHGAVYLGVLLLVALIVSVASFRRRDIP